MGKETRDRIASIKSQYGLKELPDNNYSDIIDLIQLKELINKTVSEYDLINNTIGRNIFAQQIRQFKSIETPRLDVSDKRYFEIFAEEYANSIIPNDRVRLLYSAQDVLNEILGQAGSRSYEAFETEEGGILSDYIKAELQDGRGFSLLILAPPRSAKSYTALRLAKNVSGPNFEVGTIEKLGDVLYTDSMFHSRRAYRREHETLAFSTEMIDEGIEVVDSLRGVWDESIQSMIKIMKTGFFENWLLIVVTPNESDIAKKVRNSFSAVMEPFYDERNLLTGEIKRYKNWNKESGFSTWKFHANDARIKIHNLGKITKINVKMPPKEIVKQYEPLSQHYKRKIQNREATASEKRELKTDQKNEVIERKASEILLDQEKLKAVTGIRGYPTGDGVDNLLHLGSGASRRIASRLRKLIKENDTKNTNTG